MKRKASNKTRKTSVAKTRGAKGKPLFKVRAPKKKYTKSVAT